MRENKYRAWDKKEKSLGPPIKLENIDMSMMKRDLKNLIWLQYTGEDDKNGEEICEGDILEIRTWLGLKIAIAEVSFARGSFFANGEPIFNWHDKIIIGNKFQNPELLK